MRIKDAEKYKNIDPSYYKRLAEIESSNNPLARASTSSAAGLYQFTKSTWESLVNQMGKNYSLSDRFDPEKSREVVAYFTDQNKRYLQSKIGKEPKPSELYLAHFLGLRGASNLLSADPNMSVADVVSQNAINANKSIFLGKDGKPKKVKDIYNWSAKKFGEKVQTEESQTPNYEMTQTAVDNTQVSTPTIPTKILPITPQVTNLPNLPEISNLVKEESKESEPSAVQQAKESIQNKQNEERFLQDLLSNKLNIPQQQTQTRPVQQSQPFGSYILDKAKQLGVI